MKAIAKENTVLQYSQSKKEYYVNTIEDAIYITTILCQEYLLRYSLAIAFCSWNLTGSNTPHPHSKIFVDLLKTLHSVLINCILFQAIVEDIAMNCSLLEIIYIGSFLTNYRNNEAHIYPKVPVDNLWSPRLLVFLECNPVDIWKNRHHGMRLHE